MSDQRSDGRRLQLPSRRCVGVSRWIWLRPIPVAILQEKLLQHQMVFGVTCTD